MVLVAVGIRIPLLLRCGERQFVSANEVHKSVDGCWIDGNEQARGQALCMTGVAHEFGPRVVTSHSVREHTRVRWQPRHTQPLRRNAAGLADMTGTKERQDARLRADRDARFALPCQPPDDFTVPPTYDK